MVDRSKLTKEMIISKPIARRDVLVQSSAALLASSALGLPAIAEASHTNDADVSDAHQRITITTTTTKVITTTDTVEQTEKTNKDKDVPKAEPSN